MDAPLFCYSINFDCPNGNAVVGVQRKSIKIDSRNTLGISSPFDLY